MRRAWGVTTLWGYLVLGCGSGQSPELIDRFAADSTVPVYGRVEHGLVSDVAGVFPGMNADQFVAKYGSAFGIGDPASDLSPPEVVVDGGHVWTTYHRLTAGVRIYNAQLRVHVVDGDVVLATAQLPSDPKIGSATPALSAADAASSFRSGLDIDAAVELEPAELMAYNDGLATGEATPTVLAYHVRTTGTGLEAFIDASTGDVLRSWDSSLPARNRRVAHARSDPGCQTSECDLGEIRYLAHDLWFDESGSLPDATPSAAGFALYNELGEIYDYYQSRFGRDGMNGAGSEVWAILNHPDFASPHVAFYLPGLDTLFFREAYVSPSAVGHEYAHGVVIHSTKLGALGEAGALNEALADLLSIFGNGAEDWTIRARDDTLIRDLADPRIDDYASYRPAQDSSHAGSGPFSLAVYLLVHGGSHPRNGGLHVVPVAVAKVEQIIYGAIVGGFIQPGSDLTDALFGLIRVCVGFAKNGTHEVDIRDCGSIWNAFANVGLGDWDQDRDAFVDSVDSCKEIFNPDQDECVAEAVPITHCNWYDRPDGNPQDCTWFTSQETGCDLTAAPIRLEGDAAYPTIVLLDRPANYRQVRVVRIGASVGTSDIYGVLANEALPELIQYGDYSFAGAPLTGVPESAPPLEEFGLYEIVFTVATDGSLRQAGVKFMIGAGYSVEDCVDASH